MSRKQNLNQNNIGKILLRTCEKTTLLKYCTLNIYCFFFFNKNLQEAIKKIVY